MRPTPLVLLVALLGAAACSDDADRPAMPTPPPDDGAVALAYDFEDGADGWASEITDYTEATRPQDAVSETGVAPPGLEAGSGFFHLAASNPSDDVFHYLLREVTSTAGLEGGRTYDATFTVTFASNAPTGCAGIGGAPGEAVYLKVGATADQPVPVMDNSASRLSVDKGGQSQGGTAATVAGTIDNGIPCEQALDSDPLPYAIVTRTGTVEDVTTTENGSLWLFVGADSGFEGRTSIYYDRIEVTLTPTDNGSGDNTGGDGGIGDDTGDQLDVGAMAFTDCETDRYTVGYPQDWNTNSDDGLPGPCEIFHPGEIDVPEQPRDRDLDHAVSISIDAVDFDDLDRGDNLNEVLEERATTVDGRPAVVSESRSTGQTLLPDGERSTTWTIDLNGEILVATTSTIGDTDYERDTRILERMVTEELEINGGDADGATPIGGPATTERSTQEPDGGPLTVTDVRVGHHGSFDRITFEIGGEGQAGWLVEYEDDPRSPGRGDPVEVAGDAVLRVALRDMAYPTDAPVEPYDGPERLQPERTTAIVMVVQDVLYEGYQDFFIGLDAERAYRLERLTDPQRIVIDIETH